MRWNRLLLVALAMAAFSTGGCLWIAAGAAGGAAVGYAYSKGKYSQAFHAGFDDTWAATHAGLIDLGMPVIKEGREGSEGWVETTAADGSKVRLTLEVMASKVPTDGPMTQVGVRVATFGDPLLSDRILGQVGAHLVPGPGPVPPTPVPPAATPTVPKLLAPVAPPQTAEPPLIQPATPAPPK
jgi:hypothetical protein